MTTEAGSREAAAGSTPPLRVTAILDTVIVSGPGRQVIALQDPLRVRGIDLHIVLLHRRGRRISPYEVLLREQAIQHTVVVSGGPWNPGLITSIASTLKVLKPAIVQTHGYRPTAAAFALRTLRPNWEWLPFFHGETSENLKIELYHSLDKTLSRFARRRVVMSAAQKARLGPDDPRTLVIHNAILPTPPSRSTDDLQRALNVIDASPRPRFACIGRLSPEKGIDVFLRALALVGGRGQSFTAVVVGDGPERERLEAMTQRLGLADRVTFVGHLSSADSIYSRVDVVVLPSRSEGLPNTLLEAMRADRPTVATAVGGIPEVIGSSAAALLVPPDDPPALMEALLQVLQSGDDPEARRARQRVCHSFSLERRVSALAELYRELAVGTVK